MLSYQEIGPAAMLTPRLRRSRRAAHRHRAARAPGGRTTRHGEAGDSRARTSRPAGVQVAIHDHHREPLRAGSESLRAPLLSAVPVMRPFTSTSPLDEARSRLDGRRPADYAHRAGRHSPMPRDASSPPTSRHRSTCRRSHALRWTAMPSSPPTRPPPHRPHPHGCGSSTAFTPDRYRRSPWNRARAPKSRPARPCPPAPTPS